MRIKNKASKVAPNTFVPFIPFRNLPNGVFFAEQSKSLPNREPDLWCLFLKLTAAQAACWVKGEGKHEYEFDGVSEIDPKAQVVHVGDMRIKLTWHKRIIDLYKGQTLEAAIKRERKAQKARTS